MLIVADSSAHDFGYGFCDDSYYDYNNDRFCGRLSPQTLARTCIWISYESANIVHHKKIGRQIDFDMRRSISRVAIRQPSRFAS